MALKIRNIERNINEVIDFINKQIVVMSPKGGVKRYCQLSTFAIKLIKQWIKQDNLKRDSDFKFPTLLHLS